MFTVGRYRKLTLMGARFVEPGEGGEGGAGGAGNENPNPNPNPTPNPAPTPADAAAQAEAARKAAEGQQQNQQETPEQIIARLTNERDTLAREKENVRIQQQGQIKEKAKKDELLNVAKLAGIEVAEPDKETVASLTEKLTGKVLTGDQSVDEARNAKLELAIYKTAGKPDIRVNPDKLANSISFMNATKDLNPADADFESKLTEAIKAELTKDPSIKVSGGTSASGADNMGGAGGSQEVTPEQFAKMSIADKTKLFTTNPALFERLTA